MTANVTPIVSWADETENILTIPIAVENATRRVDFHGSHTKSDVTFCARRQVSEGRNRFAHQVNPSLCRMIRLLQLELHLHPGEGELPNPDSCTASLSSKSVNFV